MWVPSPSALVASDSVPVHLHAYSSQRSEHQRHIASLGSHPRARSSLLLNWLWAATRHCDALTNSAPEWCCEQAHRGQSQPLHPALIIFGRNSLSFPSFPFPEDFSSLPPAAHPALPHAPGDSSGASSGGDRRLGRHRRPRVAHRSWARRPGWHRRRRWRGADSVGGELPPHPCTEYCLSAREQMGLAEPPCVSPRVSILATQRLPSDRYR